MDEHELIFTAFRLFAYTFSKQLSCRYWSGLASSPMPSRNPGCPKWPSQLSPPKTWAAKTEKSQSSMRRAPGLVGESSGDTCQARTRMAIRQPWRWPARRARRTRTTLLWQPLTSSIWFGRSTLKVARWSQWNLHGEEWVKLSTPIYH